MFLWIQAYGNLGNLIIKRVTCLKKSFDDRHVYVCIYKLKAIQKITFTPPRGIISDRFAPKQCKHTLLTYVQRY